ncbi:MAG: uroporphyrinogen-III synthase [Burkholderiaceae bacterium]
MARLVLTHVEPRGSRIAAGLRGAGHEVLSLAFSRLRGIPEAAGRLATADLAGYHRIIVVSPSAACFAAQARPGPWPVSARFAAVGPGTGEALLESGVAATAEQVESPDGEHHDADAMLGQASFREGAGRRILVLAGTVGRRDWAGTLESRGFSVERIELYRREAIMPDEPDWQRLVEWSDGGADAAFIVTTVDAADRLLAELGARALDGWARRCIAFCPHQRIAARLVAAAWDDVRVPGGGRLLDAAIESGLPARDPGQ